MSHDHAKPRGRAVHKDWRTWVIVGLMLAAMAAYLLSLDESIVPGAADQPANAPLPPP
jgi:hypothetical protein